MKTIEGGVCAPKGFFAAGLHAGIAKNPEKFDLGLIAAKQDCAAAAMYTQNKVKGAPIQITREHLKNGTARAVIVNSGNANTCNADGEEKAAAMCRLAAEQLGIAPEDVIVASTGVIGQVLNIAPIEKHIAVLKRKLSDGPEGSDACAHAIMTTDTRKKEAAVEFALNGISCRIGGIAKGSGMIHPNMATMLCFLTTDVSVSSAMLEKALQYCVKRTFNRVSVDGDTSTNDMCSILASGLAGNAPVETENEEFFVFREALEQILTTLSKELARDGEGATKLLECICAGAKDEQTAEIIAKSVITSSLFKSAMFGADANWGRILCAVGYADADFDIYQVNVDLSSKGGAVAVCRNGAGVAFSEEEAKTILLEDEIRIHISVGNGKGTAVCWGCDLTYDYVKINGDYRS